MAWLRDYVDLPEDAGGIADRLATLGFPVDEIVARPRLTNVVVGRIAKLERHPNADRLQLCTMDVGGDATLLIATAATNVAEGQIVPVARIGAELAGGLTIARRTMRGVASEGVLCSADELALPPDWFDDGILQLDSSVPIGADAIAYFRLSEPVLEVEVTSNRPDALSIVGLARELAASYGTALREPPTEVRAQGDSDDARVTIETVDCSRFVFQRVSGIRVRPAQAWMRIRLALAGQRPINNVVDVSNFVMLELGQPLHFFDFARIAGGHLTVRDARDGERFTTLDGQERTLDPRAIVIADNDGPTSIAGIMGGARSEVEPATAELLVEAAAWTGPRIRRASAALKLRTEASSRFEKSLPRAMADLGAARAVRLLEREGATVRAPRAAGAPITAPEPLALRAGDVQRLLGFEVTDAEIAEALTSLGFTVSQPSLDVMLRTFTKDVESPTRRAPIMLVVTPPYWRADVAIAADLVEEVGRVVGYDRVRAEVPSVQAQEIDSAQFDREMELATALAALGYTEAISLSLQPASVAQRWRSGGIMVDEPVEILNPLSEDQRWMRFSIAPALLDFAARDRAVRPYRIFELGHVFGSARPDPLESVHLTALHAGGESAFVRLKSDVLALLRRATGVDAAVERGMFPSLHPGKTAALRLGDAVVGYVGVVDPRLAHLYDVADSTALATVFVETLPQKVPRRYVEPSKFPPVDRDLAVVVPLDVLAGDLVAAVRDVPLVRSANVFDEYRGPQVGEGKKSLALRIVLQSDDATLTDEAADTAMGRIVTTLHQRFGAAPRT